MIFRVMYRLLAEALLILGFVLAYYSPFLFDFEASIVLQPSVREVLLQALAVPAVQGDLALNVLGHLLPLVLLYALVTWISSQAAKVFVIGAGVLRLLFGFAAWLLMVVGNRILFPLSDYSMPFNVIAQPWVAVAAAVVLMGGLLLGLRCSFRARQLVLGGSLATLLGLVAGAAPWQPVTLGATPDPRNIIVIGIDSLSVSAMRDTRADLPHLAALLDSGMRFDRAYTPLGRTFPAWVSLLSGKSPADHGAIFNLRGMDQVDREDLVTRTLGRAGYRTVLAIDERRFSNLDESFGFDRVVGPKAGVLDFVLQHPNDTPLTNLLLQTSISGTLLPFSRFNVAAHASYDAAGFVNETIAAVRGARRIFLAVHFESGHFPFRTRHAVREFGGANEFVSRYLSALTVVDAQVGHLMEGLQAGGYLDDAMVVVLSDHGESLGEVEASTTRLGRRIAASGYGHGFDVSSEQQTRVVLGISRFRNGVAVAHHAVRTDQVSLTDLRASMERFAASGELVLEPAAQCITVETGLRLPAASNYAGIDQKSLAAQGARFYEIDRSGRMHLREDRLTELINSKDVGWRCLDRLTYYSKVDDRYVTYKLSRDGSQLTEIDPDPGDIRKVDAYRKKLRGRVGG